MEYYDKPNENIKHDLLTIASNDRLFSILDKKSQEKLLRFAYKYTKECLRIVEQEYNLTSNVENDNSEYSRH